MAAAAANTNPKSRSVTPVRRASSVIPLVMLLLEDDTKHLPPQLILSNTRNAQKAQEYSNDQKRPNVHTALHYEATMSKYGMPSNINVLIGKDKHR